MERETWWKERISYFRSLKVTSELLKNKSLANDWKGNTTRIEAGGLRSREKRPSGFRRRSENLRAHVFGRRKLRCGDRERDIKVEDLEQQLIGVWETLNSEQLKLCVRKITGLFTVRSNPTRNVERWSVKSN